MTAVNKALSLVPIFSTRLVGDPASDSALSLSASTNSRVVVPLWVKGSLVGPVCILCSVCYTINVLALISYQLLWCNLSRPHILVTPLHSVVHSVDVLRGSHCVNRRLVLAFSILCFCIVVSIRQQHWHAQLWWPFAKYCTDVSFNIDRVQTRASISTQTQTATISPAFYLLLTVPSTIAPTHRDVTLSITPRCWYLDLRQIRPSNCM